MTRGEEAFALNPTRRQILLGTAAASFAGVRQSRAARAGPILCLFSKPLPHLGYRELASTLRQLGIPGVDLTTRPGGHVLPARVVDDLPRAAAALQDEGIAISMITTGLTALGDPAARPTLYTAGKLEIPFWKLGYYRYQDLSQLDDTLRRVKRDVEGLAALSQHAAIEGGFHNHSDTFVGAAMWDHWWVLRDTDPRWMGFYFDPCHATIEGGAAGWRIGFHRLAERIKMVAVKDFYWEKQGAQWKVKMCPLGRGMVNYPEFFRMLAGIGFNGPISLHIEYEIEAPSESARREKVLLAIERDYAYLQKQVQAAFG